MRHLGSRVDTETTGDDGVTRNLKPITKVRSHATDTLDGTAVEVSAIPLKHCTRSSSRFPLKQEEDEESILVEPPNHDLACDDDLLEEMREAPLGMMDDDECGEEKKNFDLMNINITIYGISGILCEEKEPKKSAIKQVKRRSILKATKSNKDGSKATEQTAEPTHSTIPTTVAASVKRNAFSSQTVIETFLPSQPLNIQSAPGKGTKLSALWQSPSSTLLGMGEQQDENENPKEEHASFEVLRMMMKKPFSRERTPGLVENYVHEHVQIGINLCRGKELMRLGVATLIITGEEEGQVMMHIPARPCANPGVQERSLSSKSHRSGSKKRESKKSKKLKTHFENDNCSFRLDENSSLYLGVQVNPRQDVEAAGKFQEIEPSDSQLLRDAHATKSCMLEMREQQKHAQQRTERQSATASSSSNSHGPVKSKGSDDSMVIQKPATTVPNTNRLASVIPESVMAGLFCGALPGMATDNTTATHMARPNGNKVTNKSFHKKSSDDDGDSDDENSSQSNLGRKDSLPVQDVMNVKYSSAYVKSFFSAVTFAETELYDETDDEDDLQDFSELVEQSARGLAEA